MRILPRSLLLMGLAVLLAGPALAQPVRYVAGTHYDEVASPVRTSDPNKIEVTEIFWYGCPHCYAFEPLLSSWEDSLPSDVALVRSPGMWVSEKEKDGKIVYDKEPSMETHARIYYVAEALGVIDETHSLVFNEIHQRNNRLLTDEGIKQLFTSVGVDGDNFDKRWKSFSVQSAVNKAAMNMVNYGVRGVPSMVVNGKYLISTSRAVPTQLDMLKVVDFLIEKERGS